MTIIRSKAYLAAAKDQSCTNCGKRDGTVVAAHITGIRACLYGKGRGIKPHDVLTADLCYECHKAFDQNKMSHMQDQYFRKIDQSERFLTCVGRTIVRRIEQGILVLADWARGIQLPVTSQMYYEDRTKAVRELNALTDDDPEMAHLRAEEILCELLTATGFQDVAKAFGEAADRVGFWYS